jgi:acetyl-CoA carboxylase carboxyltransferase component
MGGSQAAKVLVQMQAAGLKAKGEEVDDVKEAELLKQTTDRYNAQTTPYYAAARLWVDGIIDPLETRKVISMGIEAANHAPIEKQFNVGIIQT